MRVPCPAGCEPLLVEVEWRSRSLFSGMGDPCRFSTIAVVNGFGQMPTTAGETLSGKRIVLAEQVRGHAVVLVAGFAGP